MKNEADYNGFLQAENEQTKQSFYNDSIRSGGRTGDGEYGWILTKKKNLLSKM